MSVKELRLFIPFQAEWEDGKKVTKQNMSRKQNCYEELDEVKSLLFQIVEFYETCKHDSPRSLLTVKISHALVSLRAVYDKAYLDICERLVLPTLDPVADKDVIDMYPKKIYFPNKKSTERFNEDHWLNRLKPINVNLYNLIESLQPYHSDYLVKLYEFAGKYVHNKPLAVPTEIRAVSINSKISDEWTNAIRFVKGKNILLDLQGSNIIRNLVLMDSQGITVVQGVFDSVTIINNTKFTLHGCRMGRLSIIESTGALYGNEIAGHQQINAVTVNKDKLSFEYTDFYVVNGKKVPNIPNADLEMAVFESASLKNLTRFHFETTDLEVMNFINDGVLKSEEFLKHVYTELPN